MRAPQEHDVIVWRDRLAHVIEVQPHMVVARLSDTSDLVQMPRSEIRLLPSAGDGPATGCVPVINPATWKQAATLAAAFRSLVEGDGNLDETVKTLASCIGLSERSIWRRWERYKEERTTTSLLPRPTGRRKGSRVLDAEVEEIIQRAIDDEYLVPERPRVSDVVQSIAAECVSRDIPAPCRDTIVARIQSRCPRTTTKKRDGHKVAEQEFDGVPGHVDVKQVVERVEIDHTPADVLLVASTERREVLGRPYVTLAIDCKTRMILGFYISFDPPSSASVALCLANAAMPKDELLERYGIRGEWPAQGIPREIWLDNAAEFRACALARGCEQYQIAINYRPVGKSRMGGTVERMVGTMMGDCHLLPGTTKSNVRDKGDYDSEKRAVMTLEEFHAWFIEQVVTQYHLKIHRSLDTSPLLAWKGATFAKAPKPPVNALGYYTTFLPGDNRKLTRMGVQLHGLTYWSSAFSPWVGKGQTVLVTYHPNDVRRVYVRLPDGMVVEAAVTQHGIPEIGVKSWMLSRMARRSAAMAPEYQKAKAAGLKRNQQRVKDSKAACDRARRAAVGQEAALHDTTSEQGTDCLFDLIHAPEVIHVH